MARMRSLSELIWLLLLGGLVLADGTDVYELR